MPAVTRSPVFTRSDPGCRCAYSAYRPGQGEDDVVAGRCSSVIGTTESGAAHSQDPVFDRRDVASATARARGIRVELALRLTSPLSSIRVRRAEPNQSHSAGGSSASVEHRRARRWNELS